MSAQPPRAADPIFAEVIGNHLLSVAEEMTAAMVRSAYSPAIRDRHDCSSALLTRNGETIAEAADLPIHLGALVGIVSDAVTHYGLDRLRDGEVLLANDPYQGSSTHLNDITAIAPIFLEGELAAFGCVTAHHSDVGGKSPGSETVDAESIFQEGVRLPCLLAYRDGGPLQEVLDLVALNSRAPEERAGDLRAQIGSVLKGRQRMQALAEKYGRADLLAAIGSLLDHTEARFRAQLAALPDGSYSAEETLDPQRSTGAPVVIRVAIEKTGDRISFDFAGTSAQIPEGRNCSYGALVATVHYALRALVDPELETNSGFFRAVEVRAPAGCLVHTTPPFPVSTRVSTCQYIAVVIFKALAPVWPDRVVTGCDGRRKVIFSGPDPETDRFFVYHESNAGGIGAHAGGDGIDGAVAHVIQIRNMPVEALELAFPLAVERLELIQDSGGAGRWRGGAGVRRDYVVLGETARCSLVSERSNERLSGLFGGEPGGRGRFIINPGRPDETEADSSRLAFVPLERGDVLRVETAGAGGYGDARTRPPELVVRDVEDGRVSPRAALAAYGVDVRRSQDGRWNGRRVTPEEAAASERGEPR